MSIDKHHEITHPSFGVVQFNRCHGSAVLFQSHFQCGEIIRLTISRAKLNRHLSNDWIHATDELIEVEMSPNQFAELITHMNIGSGIPCTIKHIGCERVPPPEYINKKEVFDDEFEVTCENAHRNADEAKSKIAQLLSHKSVPKSVQREVMGLVEGVTRVLHDSLPFIQRQYSEAMDKVVTEAKADVANFVDSKIRSLGINALESEIAMAISAPLKAPVLNIEDSSSKQ